MSRHRLLGMLGIAIVLTALAMARQAPPSCALSLVLVDALTGRPLPGVIRIVDDQGRELEPPELLNRGQGLSARHPTARWWVLPERTVIHVPAAPLLVSALAGLETELTQRRVDLSGRSSAELTLPLERFYNARNRGYVAGNTHLHLQKLSKDQADRYLGEVPLGDGLDVVFVSYLERAMADLEYTSNNYSPDDLRRLSTEHLRLGHGQEHRHNFGPYEEGYGHILLLDIPYLIQPVSIGPGITGAGSDAPPMQTGIDVARREGGTVIWAHNMFGHEDIPNWITGRVQANNIFDGGTRGSYKNSFYRYLNAGLRVPFSSGTDWFIYDFSRVYVMTDRPVTPREWLVLLAEGRSYITNGPLLEFTVNGQPLGATIDLAQSPQEVTIAARALGRVDFGRLELVQNGQVVASHSSRPAQGRFVAELSQQLSIDSPCWLAVRTPPPPVPEDPELQLPVPLNEYGGALFAHTSPIYVTLNGRGVFDVPTARGLVAEMRASLEKINQQAVFASAEQRQQVEQVYRRAISALEGRLAQ